jgi:hypothetical protein
LRECYRECKLKPNILTVEDENSSFGDTDPFGSTDTYNNYDDAAFLAEIDARRKLAEGNLIKDLEENKTKPKNIILDLPPVNSDDDTISSTKFL